VVYSLKIKKIKTRKKDKGNQTELIHDSGTMTTMIKTLFSWFRTFNILYMMKDFNENSGFIAVLEEKWEELIKSDASYGTKYYAAVYDLECDEKI